MKLPAAIQELAEQGLAQMQADPSHHFDWRIRRSIYYQARTIDAQAAYRAHCWLGVLAAEYVLPIITSTFPDNPVPERLVSYARRVASGERKKRSWRITQLEEEGYICTGIDMIDLRDGIIAYNAEYAGAASYHALMEARGGHDLLDDVEELSGKDGYYEAGKILTDEDIGHLAAYCDTAGVAAIAFACERERFSIQPQRLQIYWQWWVKSALPEAWRLV